MNNTEIEAEIQQYMEKNEKNISPMIYVVIGIIIGLAIGMYCGYAYAHLQFGAHGMNL